MVEIVVEAEKPEPLDLKDIARKAATDFGLSLLDDRSYWTHPQSITADMVFNLCTEVAHENAASAVSQQLGKLIEAITASVDFAYSADGAFADFDAVIETYAKDIKLDFSAWPGNKASWDDKVLVVRTALNAVLTTKSIGAWLAPITTEQLLAYANKDDRLHTEGLRKDIAALSYPGATVPRDPTDPGPIPEFLDRNKKENTMAKKTKTDDSGWDDEPATVIVKTDDSGWEENAPSDEVDWGEPAPAPDNKGVRGASPYNNTGMSPKFCIMADLAGISNDVMAVIMSNSKPYYSMIKSGKRKWPGLAPEQIAGMRTELQARREAIAQLESALALDEIIKPGV